MTRRPIAVGFGISSPSQAAAAAEYAEAAVIGSQFISIIRENTDFQAALGVSRDLVRSCLEAMNPSHSAREKPL